MHALILAAGYATRLYPLTRACPKPLLPVAGRPVVQHILERLRSVPALDGTLVVTNAKFAPPFRAWSRTLRLRRPPVILNDGTTSNRHRLGAIGDMALALRRRPELRGDLLIVAGDNLFDWSLASFVRLAHRRRPAATLGLQRIRQRALLRQYGTVRRARNGRLTAFIEKSPHPASSLVALGIYYFPAEVLTLLQQYVAQGGLPDAPGYFLEWLIRRHPVYGHIFRGSWYDIGDFSSYRDACRAFTT